MSIPDLINALRTVKACMDGLDSYVLADNETQTREVQLLTDSIARLSPRLYRRSRSQPLAMPPLPTLNTNSVVPVPLIAGGFNPPSSLQSFVPSRTPVISKRQKPTEMPMAVGGDRENTARRKSTRVVPYKKVAPSTEPNPKPELHMTIDRMLRLQTNDLLLVQDLPEILLRPVSSRRSSKLTLADFFSRAVNGIQRADMTTWEKAFGAYRLTDIASVEGIRVASLECNNGQDIIERCVVRNMLLDRQFTQAMGNVFVMDVLSRVNQILFAEEFSTFTQPQKTAFYRSVYFALPQNQQQFNGNTYQENVKILKTQHTIKLAMETWKVGQIATISARNRQYRLYKKFGPIVLFDPSLVGSHQQGTWQPPACLKDKAMAAEFDALSDFDQFQDILDLDGVPRSRIRYIRESHVECLLCVVNCVAGSTVTNFVSQLTDRL